MTFSVKIVIFHVFNVQVQVMTCARCVTKDSSSKVGIIAKIFVITDIIKRFLVNYVKNVIPTVNYVYRPVKMTA